MRCFLWSDLGKKIKAKLFDSEVEDFCVDGGGVAILSLGKMLKLPNGLQKCMKTVNWIVKWTIIIKACKSWILCGEYEGKATIVSVNFKAALCSELYLKMTCNGFKGKPNMLCLKTAITREKKAIVLATERDGWCHLISISYGTLDAASEHSMHSDQWSSIS